MFRFLFILPICIILLCGPRMVTQTVAWTGMLVENIPQQGIYDGISDTFDGLHPCGLCDAIQEQSTEADTAPHQEEQKLLFHALLLQQQSQFDNTESHSHDYRLQNWALHCHYGDIYIPPPIA